MKSRDVFIKKVFTLLLLCNFIFMQAVYAVDTCITPTGQTATSVVQAGNTYNISTGTNVGSMGVNSFSRFNVGNGTTVNLNLTSVQNKLLNLIYDSSASQIDGIVNSYKNGQIGGNILFANPNGFVIGPTGQFNVGALTLMTPTQSTMDKLFKNGAPVEEKLTDLISFEITADKLLKLKDNIGINPNASITIQGKINSGNGIDLIAGKEVNIANGAELNANLAKINPADYLVNTSGTDSTVAINNGKDIVIIAMDTEHSVDKIGNAVNVSGVVNTNTGGDAIINAQSYSSHNAAVVNFNDGADINANNISAQAINKVDTFYANTLGLDSDTKDLLLCTDDAIEYLTPQFADLKASVNAEANTKFTASGNVSLKSTIDAELSNKVYTPMLAINYTQINSSASTVVKANSTVDSNNLTVAADTNIKLDQQSKSTNIGNTDNNKAGTMAVNVLVENVSTNAEIQKNATLKVKNNININANTVNAVTMAASNTLLPIVDKDRGALGLGISVAVMDVNTTAKMNADALIGGNLVVNANSTSTLASSVSVSTSGGEGETGTVGKYAKTFVKNLLFSGTGTNALTKKVYSKLDNIKNRGNTSFGEFSLTGGVNVGVEQVSSSATIGDAANSIKPQISAGTVSVTSATTEYKGYLSTVATAENSASAYGGAVSVNYKDLESNATIYGDLTLNNADASVNALNITSSTTIVHPLSYVDDWGKILDSKLFKQSNWDDMQTAINNNLADSDFKSDDVTTYPDGLTAITSGIKDHLDMSPFSIIASEANVKSVGLNKLFSTYSQAAVNAKAQTGSTKAFSGAVAASVFDSGSTAALLDGSSVKMKGTNINASKINITSTINAENWSMAGMFNPTEITSLMSGSSARDGSSGGAGISFNYSDNENKAYIGKNVTVTNDSSVAGSVVGDINIQSTTNKENINAVLGSTSSDNSSLTGSIGLALISGTTQAYTDTGSTINANNLTVKANNDSTYVNAVMAISYSENAIALGVGGLGVYDTVKSYVDGNITLSDSASINSDYSMVVVNASVNVGAAKSGTNPPAGKVKTKDSEDALANKDDEGVDLADTCVGKMLGDETYNPTSTMNKTKNELASKEAAANQGFDFTKATNPDKTTKAGAGGVNVTVLNNSAESYIASGATVKAQKNITVNSNIDGTLVNAAAVVAANGKSGAGGTITLDVLKNNSLASIKSGATVDAGGDLTVGAKQSYVEVQASVGVVTGKSTSGAGSIGTIVQVNDTEAIIDTGANINQDSTISNNKQTVSLNASNDNLIVKAIGGLSVQAGGTSGSGSAKGGIIDASILTNTVKAYINGANVNANKSLTIAALDKNKYIDADVSGAISTGGSAYSGILSANVVANTITSGINNSTINSDISKADNAQSINIKAEQDFSDVIVEGLGAGGKSSSYGASIRGDILDSNINSNITNSTVTSKGTTTLTNKSSIDEISVIASGAGSSNGTAAVGSAGLLMSLNEQDNYIKNSTLDAYSLSLDSDNIIKTVSVTGAAGISTGGSALGGSFMGIIGNNKIDTYVDSSTVKAKNAISLDTNFDQDIISVAVAGSGATKAALSGSIVTYYSNSDINTYISNSQLKTDGNITVNSVDTLNLLSITGTLSISTGKAAVGGSIFTDVLTGNVKSYISGTTLDSYTTSGAALGDLAVTSSTNQDIDAYTISGSLSASGIGVAGSADTFVNTKSTSSYLDNVDNINSSTVNKVNVTATSQADLMRVIGQLSGGKTAGVGGSIETVVMDQDVNAQIRNGSNLNVKDTVSVISHTNLKDNTYIVGLSGGGNAAIQGAVSTKVLNIDSNASIEGSTIASNNKNVTIDSENTLDLDDYIITLSGAGSAAIGGTVFTMVNNNTSTGLIKDSTITNANNVSVTGNINDDYLVTIGNAAVSGSVAVAGAVNTMVVSTKANAKVDNSTVQNSGDTLLNAADLSNFLLITGQASISGSTGVGGSVLTLVLEKETNALIKSNSTITSGGNVKLTANSTEPVTAYLIGLAIGGNVGVSGVIGTFVSENKVNAGIDSSIVTSNISNSSSNVTTITGTRTAYSGVSLSAQDSFTMDGVMGSLGGGTVGVGATVFTSVISNVVNSYVSSSDVTATNASLDIFAATSERFGTSSSPFATASGSGGVVAVNGDVSTIVVSSEANSTISGKKSAGVSTNKTNLDAQGQTTINNISGSLGGGVVAVGATINTIDLAKKVNAKVSSGAKINSNNVNLNAKSTDSLTSYTVSGSGGVVSVNGAVDTNVLGNNVEAGIISSEVTAPNITINANQITNLFTVAGGLSGGAVGISVSVLTNVVENGVSAFIDNSTVNSTGTISINAKAEDTIEGYVCSGGVGAAAAAGAIGTNVIQNDVTSYATGNINQSIDATNSIIDVNAESKATYTRFLTGVLTAGGTGIGGSVQTNVLSNDTYAYVGGNIKAKNITADAISTDNLNNLYSIGFSAGSIAVNGSALTNVVSGNTKAYTTDNSAGTINVINATNNFALNANSTTNINALSGGASIGAGAFGASVLVNSVTKNVEAYTGNYNTINNANTISLNAASTNNLGSSGNENRAVTGSAGLLAGLAGSVLVDYVADSVHAGLGSHSDINQTGSSSAISIAATDNTNIYDNVGSIGASALFGMGASVGVEIVKNSVVANVGANSDIDTAGAITVSALSNEIVNANALVIGGGLVGLSGGVLVSSIGENVSPASSSSATTSYSSDSGVNRNTNQALTQGNSSIASANTNVNNANTQGLSSYNNMVSSANSQIGSAKSNVNTGLTSGLSAGGASVTTTTTGNLTDTPLASRTTNFVSSSTNNVSMGASSTTVNYADTVRKGATSAFVGAGTTIDANGAVAVKAQDTDDVDLNISGYAGGAIAIGVAAAVSNVNTTVESFVMNNSTIKSLANSILINSISNDSNNVHAQAASGGIISGSGSVAIAESNKLTRVYTKDSDVFNSNGETKFDAESTSDVDAVTSGGSYGGITVGVASSRAKSKGETSVNLGASNSVISGGDLNIIANATTNANANSAALTGSLIGSSGAGSDAYSGQYAQINIGSNFSANVTNNISMQALNTNTSYASSNGRAYGGISVGGAKSNAQVDAVNGINIADATTDSEIKAKQITINSNTTNNTTATTEAGAGAFVGISGSGASSTINSSNGVTVGSNYNLKAVDALSGDADVVANNIVINAQTQNNYRSYNNSSAYGAVGATVGTVRNSVNSSVSASDNAKSTYAEDEIAINAYNATSKPDYGYDLQGGAGGIAGIGSASLNTSITQNTYAALKGDSARTDNGDITVSAQNNNNVTDKVYVYAAGGLAVAGGYSTINATLNATTDIGNKNISSGSDILYNAETNSNLYSKSDVKTEGLAPLADGDSYARSNSNNTVNILSGANSTSARDTYVQAYSSGGITAVVNSSSEGLLWDFGSTNANAIVSNSNKIDIKSGANLTSSDKVALYAQNSSGASGSKSAKTKFYLLFGIPITIHSYDNSNDSDKSTSIISNAVNIDGSVQSGLGSIKWLTYESNGSKTGNILVGAEKFVAVATVNDLADQKTYLASQYNQSKTDTATAKQPHLDSQKDWNDLGDANTAKATAYGAAIDDVTKRTSDKTSLDAAKAILAADDSKTPADTHKAHQDAVDAAQLIYDTDISNIQTHLTAAGNSDTSSNYATTVSTGTLTTYKTNCTDAATTDYASAVAEGKKATDIQSYFDNTITTQYNASVAAINADIAEANANGGSLTVSSATIKNTEVRSGEVDIKAGSLTGSGHITAPGNDFEINVTNRSTGNITYNDLIIDNDVRGKIYLNGWDLMQGKNTAGTGTYNSLHLELLRDAKDPLISIYNMVDANDPSVQSKIDGKNKAGDMMFDGLVQNINGTVNITNLTGSVIVNGSILSKTLEIAVPNGDYFQAFSNSELDTAGSSGAGSIYVGNDIDIFAKTINVNGLIQSGSAENKVTINGFNVRRNPSGTGYQEQLSDGSWADMQQCPTKGYENWYQITGDATNGINVGSSDYNVLNLIKAYYDVNSGQIVLFNSSIRGGNVTLVGNVVSSGNGRIKLVSGYGTINVTNNSGKDLIVNNLNANNYVDGKLRIVDFDMPTYLLESDYAKEVLDFSGPWPVVDTSKSLSWNQLTTLFKTNRTAFDAFVTENSATYTASRSANGTLNVGKVDPGSIGNDSTIVANANGTVTYTPGTNSVWLNGEKKVYYQEYVSRSWWTEFWHGKLYVTKFYMAPNWLDAKSPVTVSFAGVSTPSVNINSNGNIILNGNISAETGSVNIANSLLNGSITEKKDYDTTTILAKDINVYSDNIGTSSSPVRTILLGGKLTARGYNATTANNAFISLQEGNLTNFDIRATNIGVTLANGSINADNNALLLGNVVNLETDNGGVTFANAANFKADNGLSVKARDNISIASNSNIVVDYVKSDAGDISLVSAGSITGKDKVSDLLMHDSHIDGKNVTLSANSIGTNADDYELSVKTDGILNASATNNISIYSPLSLHIGKILSGNGDVRLIANKNIYGEIYDYSNTPYNIQANNLFIVSVTGNIESTVVDLSGSLKAYAGYKRDGTTIANTGDIIQIYQQNNRMQNYKTATDAQKEAFLATLRDLNVNQVKADRMFITSERSIYGASGSLLTNFVGNDLILSSVHGALGTDSKPLTVSLNGSLSAFADDSIYINSDKDLNVKAVMNYNDKATTTSGTYSPLNYVRLTSTGNIYDASDEYIMNSLKDKNGNTISTTATLNEVPNIIAKEIVLIAGKDIGRSTDALDVYTYAGGNGLTAIANSGKMNIASIYDTKIKALNSSGNVNLLAKDLENNTFKDLTIANLTAGGNLTANSQNLFVTGKITVDGDTQANAITTATINDADLNTATINATDINITNMLGRGNAKINSSHDTNITNATFNKDLDLDAGNNFNVTGKLTVRGNTQADVVKTVNINDADLNTATISATDINITNMLARGNTKTNSSRDTNITNATFNKDLDLDAGNNFNVTNKLTVSGNTQADVVKTANINDADLNAATINATDINITDMLARGDTKINSSHDTNIKNAKFNMGLNLYAGNDFNVTNKMTVLGSALIDAEKTVNINDADLAATAIIATDINITNMAVSDVMTMIAGNDINITNGTLQKDLDMLAMNNITIKEINLLGNLNALVDKNLNINTSHDLNIGLIASLNQIYTDNVKINSQMSIKNGLTPLSANIGAYNIDLDAGINIGEVNKRLNIVIPESGGLLDLKSGKNIDVNVAGGPAYFSNIVTGNANLGINGDTTIDTLNIDTGFIRINSSKISLNNGTINKFASIYTRDKFIWIDNTSLRANGRATVQFFVKEKPLWFKINDSKDILTNHLNVTRHKVGIFISGVYETNSMEALAGSVTGNILSGNIADVEPSFVNNILDQSIAVPLVQPGTSFIQGY